jgi:hypothetical protein
MSLHAVANIEDIPQPGQTTSNARTPAYNGGGLDNWVYTPVYKKNNNNEFIFLGYYPKFSSISVNISDDKNGLITAKSDIVLTFTFSTLVEGFTISDLILSTTTCEQISPLNIDNSDPKKYSLTIRPKIVNHSGTSIITISVPSSVVKDKDSDAVNDESKVHNITVNIPGPIPTLSTSFTGTITDVNTEVTINVNFNENVIGLSKTHFTLTNIDTSTAVLSGSGKNYTLKVKAANTLTGSGNISIFLNKDKVVSEANDVYNVASGATSLNIGYSLSQYLNLDRPLVWTISSYNSYNWYWGIVDKQAVIDGNGPHGVNAGSNSNNRNIRLYATDGYSGEHITGIEYSNQISPPTNSCSVISGIDFNSGSVAYLKTTSPTGYFEIYSGLKDNGGTLLATSSSNEISLILYYAGSSGRGGTSGYLEILNNRVTLFSRSDVRPFSAYLNVTPLYNGLTFFSRTLNQVVFIYAHS